MPSPDTRSFTVAQYLQARLEQLGLDRMFGVAGNYTAAFLDTILADPNSKITISGNPNELCSGFAADAYARYKGIGAIYVTYSVGAFTCLNTIAGSFVEQVPVILINGAPTSKEESIEENACILFSHTTGDKLINIEMFRPITAAAERISNATQAPYQIDSILTALYTTKKPVYLEVVENVWRANCTPPTGEIVSGMDAIVTVSGVKDAVDKTIDMLKRRPKFAIWAGAEIIRYQLQQQLQDLLKAINAKIEDSNKFVGYFSSPTSKSVLGELDKLFQGTVEFNNHEINHLVGEDGTLVGIGSWLTGKNTGNQSIHGDGRIFVVNNHAMIGEDFYASVHLKAYMEQLTKAINNLDKETGAKFAKLDVQTIPIQDLAVCDRDKTGILYDHFFKSIGEWLTKDDIIIADAGFSLIGAQYLPIASQGGFIAQASWLSIGYSVPAATGVKCANPDKRVIVIVGDGAFHETCQAVSDHASYGQNTVVFVLANGLYGIEQYIINPNVFRPTPTDYSKNKLLNKPYKYNELAKWNFSKITEVFGGIGLKANTFAELEICLADIRSHKNRNFVVEVTIPELDSPSSLKAVSQSKVGEDEIANPQWPPKEVF